MTQSPIPGGVWTLAKLEDTYPWIRWREPQAVSSLRSPARYACRICIANHGLKEKHIGDLPTDAEEIRRHIEAEHVRRS